MRRREKGKEREKGKHEPFLIRQTQLAPEGIFHLELRHAEEHELRAADDDDIVGVQFSAVAGKLAIDVGAV